MKYYSVFIGSSFTPALILLAGLAGLGFNSIHILNIHLIQMNSSTVKMPDNCIQIFTVLFLEIIQSALHTRAL